MPVTLITGVPGTGKTAFLVSELEKIAATGRKIFVDNITGLKLEVYRAGKVTEWQKGTWLHIDQYKRTTPSIVMGVEVDEENDGNENWIPNSEVVKDKDGALQRLAFDEFGKIVGSVPYESHKGALLVVDEAQRHFRPRPAGSVVPDHVAALEVHRHQGLDIWLVAQRPGLLDSNVRALCGKHIAFRSTSLGRYKYEWPEVGDIESKSSRDQAAKSRYRLPKKAFDLYKSAEVHTVHKHKMPLVAKALFLIIPLAAVLIYSSYKMIGDKSKPVEVAHAQPVQAQVPANIQHARLDVPLSVVSPVLPVGFEPYALNEIKGRHPYERMQLSIVGRLKSATKDVFRFSAVENGQHAFGLSSHDLQAAGYLIVPLNDCSVKLIYKEHEFFITCSAQPVQQITFQNPSQLPPNFSPYP